MVKRGKHPNSKKNLQTIRTHEQAAAKGASGGKASSERKRWAQIRNCTNRCPYHGRCPLLSMSLKNKGKCVLHSKNMVSSSGVKVELPQEIINAFFNFLADGREGLIHEILSALYTLRLKSTKGTIKEQRELISTMIEVLKAVHGEKHTHEGKIEAEVTHDFSDEILKDPEAADLACKLFERIAVGKGDARGAGEDGKQLSMGTTTSSGADKQKAS